MSGLRTALTSSVNLYAKKKKLLKGDALSGDDVRGFGSSSSVKHPDPSFSSQTKDKLVSSEVTGIAQTIVYDKLGEFFEENLSVAKQIVRRQCLRPRLGRQPERPGTLLEGRGFWKEGVCQANLPTVNLETQANVRFTSWRAILRAVQRTEGFNSSDTP